MSDDENQHKPLDTTLATDSLWLVKVPKYIATRWAQCADGNVGTLFVKRRPKEKPQMSLVLSEHVLNDESKETIPKEYKLNASQIREQYMAAFIEESPQSQLKLKGHLSNKVSVCPIVDKNYLSLKKDTIRKALAPKRTAKQLDNIVHSFKPVSDHIENNGNRKKKRVRIARNDPENIMAMVFEAFGQKRYFNIHDLVKITKEPIQNLKDVLRQVCQYNTKGPNKSMWELKPEYSVTD